MTNAEKAELKKQLKLNFNNTVAHAVEVLDKQVESLSIMSTAHQSPARCAKLLIFFAASAKGLCDIKHLAVFPMSSLKRSFFATGAYEFITGIVDEAEAVEQTKLLAVTAVADYLIKEDL